jgi:hypothetical protein
MDELLKEMLANAERQAREKLPEDAGHHALVADITELLRKASELEYHDMLSEANPAPKMALADELSAMRQNVINGKYDN